MVTVIIPWSRIVAEPIDNRQVGLNPRTETIRSKSVPSTLLVYHIGTVSGFYVPKGNLGSVESSYLGYNVQPKTVGEKICGDILPVSMTPFLSEYEM